MNYAKTRASALESGLLAGSLLLLLLAMAQPASAQTETAGQQMADQAYHSLEMKQYPLAIDAFVKALSDNPSNSSWRKDLAYAYVSAGSPAEAMKEFKRVYRDDPNELDVALELGFLSQQMHEDNEMEAYFRDASRSSDEMTAQVAKKALADLATARLQQSKQKAYDLLAANRRAEATELFEKIHREDPNDAATALQLGYLYDAAGNVAKAREIFRSQRGSSNVQVAARAEEAYDEIGKRSALVFATVYAAPFYQSRFSNVINPVNAKIGLRPLRFVEPYFGWRFSRDTRSKTGTLPEIYSDNAAIFSGGLESPLPGGTTLYAEAGTAVSIVDNPTHGRTKPDYRAGLNWFHGWGKSMTLAAQTSPSAFSFTASGYSDASYYSRFNRNVIGEVQFRAGLNLPTGRALPMQLLAAVNAIKDNNHNFYNNVVEAGPALRIAPSRHLTTVYLEAQYLRGAYTLHDPANPYGSHYGDLRISMVWSNTFKLK